jgi:2-oxoglutarate dehydrogenase E2 component (dihydrolipoamide succinyltransferase)
MSVDVVIPQIGESITSVFIARWLKKPGEAVAAGEPILSVDSDKASVEVPSPAAGVLSEILANDGDEVPIGAVVARLGDAAAAPSAPAPTSVAAPAAAPDAVRAGPAARHAATEKGVDLASVDGTGKHGRVTSADVAKVAAPAPVATAPAAAPAAPVAPPPVAPPPVAPRAAGERVQRVKMTPMRRTIARRLVEAQATAAMLTTFNEVDMHALMELRRKYQDGFVKKHGIKLGFMSFFVKAAIEALKEFPAVNAEIDGTDILYKSYYNIGVAVSGPKGLLVPVLRDADRLSFAETEKGIAALGTRARDGKLGPEDFEDGTFTISNGGIFGSMMSTPILNPPQVGILGMHNIIERPVAIDGQVVIRPMMYLALTYDHRIIDGREAVSFLVRLKQLIEAPERMLIEA